jgi:hypothetical protein
MTSTALGCHFLHGRGKKALIILHLMLLLTCPECHINIHQKTLEGNMKKMHEPNGGG